MYKDEDERTRGKVTNVRILMGGRAGFRMGKIFKVENDLRDTPPFLESNH
jgi:hypothetical protein